MSSLAQIRDLVRRLLEGPPNTTDSSGEAAPAGSIRNAARAAAGAAFAPRHTHQTRVRFLEVDEESVIPKKSEEYRREGYGLHQVDTENKVVTCSGRIVDPAAVVLRCTECGGYDSAVFSCACGRGLCRLCRLELTMPDGGRSRRFVRSITESRWIATINGARGTKGGIMSERPFASRLRDFQENLENLQMMQELRLVHDPAVQDLWRWGNSPLPGAARFQARLRHMLLPRVLAKQFEPQLVTFPAVPRWRF